jgi:hypothetical protein
MRDFKSHPALDIVLALTRVGELLAAAGQPTAIVVLGGAALNLHGYVRRATADVDVVALAQGNTISALPSPCRSRFATRFALLLDACSFRRTGSTPSLRYSGVKACRLGWRIVSNGEHLVARRVSAWLAVTI